MNMPINSTLTPANLTTLQSRFPEAPRVLQAKDTASPELKEAFSSFVGNTFYSQMLSSMRSTVDKPAYFHGGRAEEIFQGQMDQILAEDLTKASADQFTGPMFELFMLGRAT